MDTTNELPLPESPEPLREEPVLPIGNVPGDPLCRMLDQLEASIEQPVINMFPDQLSISLDRLESSIERHTPPVDPFPDTLYETLGRLEKEIENQPPVAPGASQEEIDPAIQNGFKQMSNRQSPPPFGSLQKPEPFRRESLPLRQHPEPTYRMRGHSTGIRNSGNGFDWYCNLHQEWVSKDECESCSDFEEPDYVEEGREDVRCRYSYTSSSEEDVDQNE